MELVSPIWVALAFILGAGLMWAGCTQDMRVMTQIVYGEVVVMILNEYKLHNPCKAEKMVMELNEYTSHGKGWNQLSAELQSFITKVEYINNGDSK